MTKTEGLTKVTATLVNTDTSTATRVTVTNKHGNEMSAGLNAQDRDVLLYDLIQTLPSDHHLRKYLHI